jgi:hypothetical protein
MPTFAAMRFVNNIMRMETKKIATSSWKQRRFFEVVPIGDVP